MSGDDLNEQYQTEVDAVDEEITFTNETLADLERSNIFPQRLISKVAYQFQK